MSFGGITNFAKNALLTAQKHIDSALHIEEEIEDEEVEDEAENELEIENQHIQRTSNLVCFKLFKVIKQICKICRILIKVESEK